MKKLWLFVLILSLFLHAKELSQAKMIKLSQKGEKIVKVMCSSDKLPSATGAIDDIMKNVKQSGACKKLSKRKLEAVAYYLGNGTIKASTKHIHVPSGAKCPVCGMFVSKYPKWAAQIEHGDKKYYFDGVKDMMKYYIFDVDFPYDRNKISKMVVTDFYTLDAVPAADAWYVVGSNMYGPMGNELIPFATKKAAENFQTDHKGEKIVRFGDITPKMVMALDGIVFENEK